MAARPADSRLKRAVDVLASGLVLLATSPLFLLCCLAIRLDSPGAAVFRQERIGKDGVPFTALKFRTMVTGAEGMGAGALVERNDSRITRSGWLLRRLSLDELPQLINVVRGEMSLVGPRPTLAYQVEQYTPRQRRRLEARPGITGWAQVNGRNELSWPERIELDIWYIDHWSPWLDVKIMLRTPLAALRGEMT
jgi:lipopolysaccharide/colanic/teichoic acid biosynthesis glycosyltransferase